MCVVTPFNPRAAPIAPSWRQRGALIVGRATAQASRRLHRGGGTAFPGVVAGRLAPDLVDVLARLGHGAVTITGTNGKTTTAHLLAAATRRVGLEPVTNRAGSNLERGLVSALVEATNTRGAVADAGGRIALLEVDEAALPALWPRLRPRVALFLNLFRDQLDRYGEIDSIAEDWRTALAGPHVPDTLILNADDPSLDVLGEAAAGALVTFGVDDPAVALPHADHAADARFCRCGSTFDYTSVFVGHLGHWRCSGCDRARRTPDVVARAVRLSEDESAFELVTPHGSVPVTLPLTGLYSVYNALAAAAGALALDVPLEALREALESAEPAFGRQERMRVYGRDVRLLLAKNPTGLNEVMRTLIASAPPRRVLWLLNDDIQDGRDVSWIYDADFESLRQAEFEVVVSGTRADDLALRLHLAGIEPRYVEPHTSTAVEEALALVPSGERLDVVATYTAMLEVRELLAGRSGAAHYWEVPA